MKAGLIAAVAACALMVAAPAQAAKGTYAGTVTGTEGKIALDVKVSKRGWVKKVTHLRGVNIPSTCDISGPVTVNHDFATSLRVNDNGRFEGFFQQPTYNNVSSIAGKIKVDHPQQMRGSFRIDYHYPAEEGYPEEDCDTGPLPFTAKFGATDETLTPPPAARIVRR